MPTKNKDIVTKIFDRVGQMEGKLIGPKRRNIPSSGSAEYRLLETPSSALKAIPMSSMR